ncbi:dihydrofolate reductase family protein [Actinomadura rupiterrae]|uniref:dihydrofolate reductase family protein n=1 Tax=Actinomadura rupiterrae TaxID=559627 RepID=UPI0020A4E885|nr:dihydrofolate reductase family protein [Actinomadura rupiterrae]MCP2337629.1 dihydrofolate reductase [Actinomadura rupiterrae]
MRKLVYYVGASLDGYIAGPSEEIDFYPLSAEMSAWIGATYPETIPVQARAHFGVEGVPNAAFDTILMGRGTYEPGLRIGLTSPYPHLRQYVVSTTLEIDDPSVRVESDDPPALVRRLKAEDTGKDIWLCGGGKLAGALLPEIDEIVLKTYPVIAGTGIPMTAGPFDPTLFTPTRRHTFENGAQTTWLTRA